MRTNLPVTDKEIHLTDKTLIVSKTDTKGLITYVNRDFLEVSGFSEAELIGQPHNIVRHPDMPVEAFEDMWRTFKEGRPWTGFVKNRCKNGDYYWVLANASPIFEGGTHTGYISVRRRISEDQKSQMEALYRQFREKRQGNLNIRYGRAVKGEGSSFANMGLYGRMILNFVIILPFLLLLGAIPWLGLKPETAESLSAIALVLTCGAGALVSFGFVRKFSAPLAEASRIFHNITDGNYSNSIDVSSDNEMGKLFQSLQMMQTRLGFEVAESKRVADEMTRIKIALDNVSTGVMIADGHRTIIYTNRAVERILKGAESAIRTHLPNFNASQLLGANIDQFHRNPAHQAGLLGSLQNTHTANLEIGGRHMQVTANPVLSGSGERLGSVAEWKDRTGEVLVQREVEELVQAAAAGDFSKRLKAEG
ncbi:MAG: PAS domain-containing protein, partial [Zoogloea sp.]|uniref:PAS domain-containing protein n=1 Tax=Zoogloea sp. TaxID=49181 RepID=UPI003F2E97BC